MCNLINTWYCHIVPEERYSNTFSPIILQRKNSRYCAFPFDNLKSNMYIWNCIWSPNISIYVISQSVLLTIPYFIMCFHLRCKHGVIWSPIIPTNCFTGQILKSMVPCVCLSNVKSLQFSRVWQSRISVKSKIIENKTKCFNQKLFPRTFWRFHAVLMYFGSKMYINMNIK